MNLKDKTIIVTGAGSGLGKAVCLRAAQEGANLVLADINQDALETAEKEIQLLGAKTCACVVDVCSKDSIDAMMKKAVETFGSVQGLVNSAGIFSSVPFLELSEKQWDSMIDINVKGSFFCSQAFISSAVEKKVKGSIVFLSSISGYIGFAGSAHYCASKGAVRQLSKALALEFGPCGIRSNIVAPGTIETPMNAWFMQDDEMSKKSVASIPLGRYGKSEEIASAIVYLLSDEASFCTGTELLVDGGQISHC